MAQRTGGAAGLGLLVLLLAVLAALVAPTARATDGTDASGLAETPVSFTSADGTVLHGELIARSGSVHRPALVMVGGAGPVPVGELRPAAEAYARHGIPTLVYDKRTAGYSTTHRDYHRLADDALAAVRLLRARPEADPSRVGLWGLSEGAWVVSLAAGRSADVDFVVTAGAVGLTPARQQAWAYGGFLRHEGISGSLLPTMQVTVIRQLVAAGLFPEADYDPVPAWQRVHQPVLAEWGTLDREAAPAESEPIIRQALEAGGNRHYTLRTVPDVRHNLQRTFADGYDRPGVLPADYADYESAWIDRLATALPPATADPTPPQGTTSRPLAPLAWYEQSWLQASVTALCLAGFAGYLLTGAVRRLRRRPRPADLPRTARWAALTGGSATLGAVGYLLFQAITAGALPGPVLVGRAVLWLALQFLAGCAVLLVGATAVSALRRPLPAPARVRLVLLVLSGTAFVPWALYWGLLRP